MWQQNLAQELNDAIPSQRDGIISCYETLTGKSRTTLYRIARKNGFSSGRKQRSDKGDCCLDDRQIDYLAGLIHTSSRQKKGPIMDVETALDIAVQNGEITAGQVSVSRATAILQERGLSARHLKRDDPHTTMKSKHPNHIHVFDSSICVQYYLRGKKGACIMDERDFNVKKPKNLEKISKNRIIRFNLVDHYSGYIYLKYYNAHAENKEITYDFLTSAWRGGEHDGIIFKGVPTGILMDAGAFNMAKSMLNFFKALDIQIPASMPHNARRQGSSESAHNIIERKFESRLAFQPAWNVEQLNKWAFAWSAFLNNTRRHSRHGQTRTAFWSKITSEQLRLLPSQEILHALFAEPVVSRTVGGDYSISYKPPKVEKKQFYNLKDIGVAPGDKVDVRLHPFWWPDICVIFEGKEFRLEPIEFDESGFRSDAPMILEEYKDVPYSPRQRKIKEIEKAAYGDDIHKPRAKRTPFSGDINPFQFEESETITDVVDGEEMDIDIPEIDDMTPVFADVVKPVCVKEEKPIYEDKTVPVIEFLARISDCTGEPIDAAMNEMIRGRFGSFVSVVEMEKYIATLEASDGGFN